MFSKPIANKSIFDMEHSNHACQDKLQYVSKNFT